MRLRRRLAGIKISAAAALAVAALALTACTAPDNTPSTGGSSATDSTLVIDRSTSDMKTTDPGRNFETTGVIVGRALYDTLVTFENGDSAKPIPMLATEWTSNDDATEYTFTLRDDVTFTGGNKLTSADVVFSLTRVANLKGNGSFLMEGLTVTAPDETHVKIASTTSNTAIPAIMTAPTLGILDSAVAKEHGATDATDAATADTAQSWLDKNSAGSGPYTLNSMDPNTETVMTRNEEYWGDEPRYTKVVLRNATAETQSQDLQSGTAQVALDLGNDQVEPLKSNADLKVASSASPTLFFLFSNANPQISKITSQSAFREAVKYGLDYDSLLDLAGEGAIRAAGVVPNSFLGALEESAATDRDVDKAKDAVSRIQGLAPVTLEYPGDISSNGLEFGPIAERIQANLKEVGLTIKLAPTPVATSLQNYRDGKEEMGLWLWNPDYPDPADYLVFGPGATVGLRAGWTADDAKDLAATLPTIAATVSDDERGPLYQSFQADLNDIGVFAPLFQPAAWIVSTTDVGEVTYSPAFTVDIAAIGR